jgi:hypothetical protein
MYCSFDHRADQTARRIINTWLIQLLEHLDPDSPIVTTICSRDINSAFLIGDSCRVILDIAESMADGKGEIRLVGDGFDELDDKERNELLRRTKEITQAANVHVLLFFRNSITNIVRTYIKTPSPLYVELAASQNQCDIRQYLVDQLEKDQHRDSAWSQELEEDILEGLGGSDSTYVRHS